MYGTCRWGSAKEAKVRQMTTYFEHRPVHRHADAVIVRPPLQVLVRVGVLYGVSVLFVDLRQFGVLRDVQTVVYLEERLLEEVQPLLFELLTLFEHHRHILHVLGVRLVNLAQSGLVSILRLLHVLSTFGQFVLQFLYLCKAKKGEQRG